MIGRLIAIWLLLCGVATAQVGQIPAWPPSQPLISSYQGPGNIVSGAVAWWGFRGYNGSYSGNAAIICTASDVSCETETISNGNLVLGSVGTACLISGTCLVKTFFDQSGAKACAGSTACDVTNATASAQPTFTAAALNSIPCATFTGSSSQNLESANSFTLAQPLTFSTVAKRTSAFTSLGAIISAISSGNAPPAIGFFSTTNDGWLFAGSNITATATNSAFHAMQGVVQGATTSSLTVDGSTTTGSSGSDVFGDNLMVGEINGADFFTGAFCEGGIWPVAFNSTQLSNMNSNQHTYWNF